MKIVVGIVVDINVTPVGKRLGGPSRGSTATATNNYITAIADTVAIQHLITIFFTIKDDGGQRNSLRTSTMMATTS